MPTPYRWSHDLKQLFVLALERYRAGERDPARFFTEEQGDYLASIGMSVQEIFDFAEDHTKYDGDPDWESFLLISAVRRDYFLSMQHGIPTTETFPADDLPAKDAQLDGIAWLPRLIKKAEAKLRGGMSEEVMYGCAGDRSFFRTHHLHPADFLRHVWAAHGDEHKVLAYVREAKVRGDAMFAGAIPDTP